MEKIRENIKTPLENKIEKETHRQRGRLCLDYKGAKTPQGDKRDKAKDREEESKMRGCKIDLC